MQLDIRGGKCETAALSTNNICVLSWIKFWNITEGRQDSWQLFVCLKV